MNTKHYVPRSLALRVRIILPQCLILLLVLAFRGEAQAFGPFGFGFTEQIQHVNDPETARMLQLKLGQTIGNDIWSGSCAICHLGGRGGTPRNVFGNAINTFLSQEDYNTPGRIGEAVRRVLDIPANPTLPDSPTFGELLQSGELPVPIFSRAVPMVRRKGPAPLAEKITVDEARKRIQQIESESRFGILQLSKTDEISPEVANTLAEFRGEFLILGIRSLTPEVAAALANSQAETIWLHSISSVSPAAAEAIVDVRGHLVLTGLAELNSPALAAKLAKRPGLLSFPYLKQITLPVATALVQHKGSLTLGGLTNIPPEIQDQLAEASVIHLPNLKSLDSMLLTKKLAENWRLFIPDVDFLNPDQAEWFANSKGQKFLSAAAMTDSVAERFSQSMKATSIVLFGKGPISDTAFGFLLRTRFAGLELRDIESPTEGQIRVMTETKRAAFFPQLKKLDSVPLVKALSGLVTFPSVVEITPDVADALGKMPEGVRTERDGTTISIPSGQLVFSILDDLPPETARLLLQRRWLSLSFPAMQDTSVESLKAMGRQTVSLTLGLTALPPELATAYVDGISADTSRGNQGGLTLPYLWNLSAESARILVRGMNRGVELQGKIRISRTPSLSIGGSYGSAYSGLKLAPEVAAELGQFEGTLMISSLRELSPESAAGLAKFPGPYLRLFGQATHTLAPETAAELAKIPGRLLLEELKRVDSIPLCDKNARDFGWYWNRVETVAPEAVPALIQFKGLFDLGGLVVLDSPILAQRIIDLSLSTGRNLHALQRISPEAAAVFATFDKPLRLGLTVLDDVAVAQAFAQAKGKIELKRLKAATPEVIAILKNSKTVDVPNLESLYLLIQSQEDPKRGGFQLPIPKNGETKR
ncbi:hypothetical protein [Tuwongella immobilis]|uniref:Cytochrome c domain-containing protein n=1 Tax=Tuwongella immobilis TaxID=692036 RepID=A0A6C2YLC2_9BACT|nr:hypothetical protein [Tuwongella immobilis]VIP01913.1 Uncharacterized protein OS=Pirellula staleyi (strain ATCC 27377 / DSM 6068 / ICPB 4128) GN=Psta_4071 PE=4 SV=1 [Tuwongella immobilis]VTR99827.1 Uncharacterized protein OS=Pirellula staleyi (strain ATCC 27377 / DSM 6068 / ICPB 4128) GN=Psta_4071 PE=4 SV=1 [Tuwongella immobilis]